MFFYPSKNTHLHYSFTLFFIDQPVKRTRNKWGEAPKDLVSTSTTPATSATTTTPATTTTTEDPAPRAGRNRWGTAPAQPQPLQQDDKTLDDNTTTLKSELGTTTTTTPGSTTTAATTTTTASTPVTSTGLVSKIFGTLPDKYASYPMGATIKHLLSIPGGRNVVDKHSQHLYPMTKQFLDSILPSQFISYPPPQGYVPPTKTETKNFIADISFFVQKLNPSISRSILSSSGFSVPDQAILGISTGSIDGMNDGDIDESVLQHGVLAENIPDDLRHISLSRNDMFVFNDLFTGKLKDPAARQAIISVILIKNGKGRERKTEIRRILRDNGKTLKLDHHLLPILSYLEHGISQQTLDTYERHLLFSLLSRIIPIYRAQFTPFVPRLLHITRTLLVHNDKFVRTEGGGFLQILTRVVGIHPILKVILSEVNSPEEMIRDVVARTLSHVSSVVGLKQLLPFLKALLESTTAPFYAVHTGLRTIQQIAMLIGGSLIPDMEEIITLIIPLFYKNDTKLITSALTAITRVCEACKPYTCPAIDEVAKVVSALAPKSRGKALAAVIQCITSFLPSLPHEHGVLYWQQIQDYVIQCCQNGDSQSLITGVTALSAAIKAETISPEGTQEHILPFLAHELLDPKYCIDKANVQVIKVLCITIAARIGLQPVYNVLIPLLRHENPFLSTSICTIISSLSTEIGLQTLSVESEGILIKNLIDLMSTHMGQGQPSASLGNNEPDLFQASNQSHIPSYVLNTIDKTGSWTRYPIIQSLTYVLIALGPQRAEKHAWILLGFAKWTMSHKEDIFRYHSAVVITRTVAQLTTPNEDNRKILREVWSMLYENLGEEKPLVLSGRICAVRATMQAMKQLGFWMLDSAGDSNTAGDKGSYNKTMVGNDSNTIDLTPSPTDMLTKLTAILHNRHECVALVTTRTLGLLGTCWGFATPSQEWVRIITQFATVLLAYNHRCIRKSVVSLIGVCAGSVGSVDIILKLLPHLQHLNRTVRIGIMSAIGSVAETCGVAMVLPLLLHLYEISDLKTCTAVLKSILVCVQQCPNDIVILPTALYPLLTHVLTAKHSKIIRIGLQIVAALMINCFALNQYEIGKQFSEAIGSYIAPLRGVNYNVNSWWWEWRRLAFALGNSLSGAYVRALYTGLFHPARVVRDNHFVWYNQILLLKQHTMPMHYAKITTSDKFVNNNPLNESGKKIANRKIDELDVDNDDEVTSFDTIAENQYYDPYVCQSLMLPF